MAFKAKEQSATEKWYEVDERLWVAEDGEKLVAEGDPKAASLFAIPGQKISVEDAERYGLVKAKAKAEGKQAAKAEDKQKAKAENKSR